MPLMKYHNGTTWVPLDAENANKLGGVPASSYIQISQKGTANGVASLGSDGKVPTSQLQGLMATGSWSDTTGTIGIAVGGTYTKTIPIGFAGKKGRLVIEGDPGSSTAKGGIIFFTTNANDAIGVDIANSSVVNRKATEGYLLQTMGVTNSGGSTASSAIKITDVYISGNDLLIVFSNIGGSDTDYLKVKECQWEVEG